MLIGRVQPKIFPIEFKKHFISLKRRMVRLTKHGVVNDSTFFSPGTVYLEEKTKPSQDLSTLSDVSVKSEVEDKKPESSQLSDSFKTSPSDTQVDSPRSKKTRCEKKNQDMTVTAQSEQRGSVTMQEQTDSYPHDGSSPAHPLPATPLRSQPPPLVDSTYSYLQQPFSNQSYSTYHNASRQLNTPPLSFSPPSSVSSGHQAFSYASPPRSFSSTQSSSPIRSEQDTSGNYVTQAGSFFNAKPLKPLKKRVSIACVKCRDRKVKVCLCGLTLNRLLSFSSLKCIPVAHEEPPRCTRCKEKNQPCQYITVTSQSEQRGRLTTPEQTDYYPYYGSGPVHPPPAPPSRPPPLDSTYSYPQQPLSNQSYSTSAYQNPDHQNTPAISFTPPSNMASAFLNADNQNAPFVSFSPPSNMSSGHQAFSHAPPRQAFPYAQPSSPIRSGQDTSGNYGTHAYFNSTYPQAQSTHQMPPE